jgi:hypothetical protein
MEHAKPTLRTLFSEGSTYRIPPYQREYEWDISRWRELWTDIISLYRSVLVEPTTPKHFLGILLLEEDARNTSRRYVIDGQQRLVTLLVMLSAIHHHQADVSGIAAKRDLLFFPTATSEEAQELGPRIRVQSADASAFTDALNDNWRHHYRNVTTNNQLQQGVSAAYWFFRFMLVWGAESSKVFDNEVMLPKFSDKQRKDGISAEELWSQHLADLNEVPGSVSPAELRRIILDYTSFVTLTVERGDQDAQVIFQSINAKRTEFSQWDFVRNDIFSPLGDEEAKTFHDSEWSIVQDQLKDSRYQSQRGDSRDIFLYDYLIARGESGKPRQGAISRNRGYSHFRRRLTRVTGGGQPSAKKSLEFARNDLLPMARAWPLAVGAATSKGAQTSLPVAAQTKVEIIGALAAGPVTPLVLRLVDEYLREKLSDKELIAGLQLVESFLGRHVLAGTRRSPLRSFIMSTMAALSSESIDGTQDTIDLRRLRSLLFPNTGSQFASPQDSALRDVLTTQPFYGQNAVVKPAQLVAVFRALEVAKSGPNVVRICIGNGGSDYSVEHVCPQSVLKEKSKWDEDLRTWGVKREDYSGQIHTLGNLALMTNEVNKWCSDKRLEQKRLALAEIQSKVQPSKGMPKMPNLRVNEFLKSAERWTPQDIKKRTQQLARELLKLWSVPAR